MKKIIYHLIAATLLLLSTVLPSHAQTPSANSNKTGILEIVDDKVTLDGERLTLGEIQGILSPEEFTDFNKAYKTYSATKAVDGICAGILVAGFFRMIIYVGLRQGPDTFSKVSNIAMAASAVTIFATIPVRISAANSMEKTINAHNGNAPAANLSLGATQNGIGLTLNF